MKELYFINTWPDLKSAWSGTPNGLFHALSKHTEVKELHFYSERGRVASILNYFTMQMVSNRQIEQQINKTAVSESSPLFSFGEYRTNKTKNMYCYQDLTIDYLLRLRQQKNPIVNHALYQLIPTSILKIKRQKAMRFYKECAGVFTMSEWLRKDLIENSLLPAEKVHCVGGGCNIDISMIDSSKKEGKRFLFIGTNWKRKNGPLVVEAFQKLSAESSGFTPPELYIAGPKERPKELPHADNIFFLGRLTHDELAQYYNLCDYFVMPSNFDAYGLVFAEALCFGLPCIGKNIHAMPEFIQDGQNGLLIRQNSADELAEAMKKMLTDGSRMVRYVQEQRDYYIDKYSWDSVAERIMQVLSSDGAADGK